MNNSHDFIPFQGAILYPEPNEQFPAASMPVAETPPAIHTPDKELIIHAPNHEHLLGLELDPHAESMVNAVVGSGMIATAAVIEAPASVDKAPRMERIKKQIKHLSAKVGTLAIATAALASWGFELGPWNETVRADVGFDMFAQTFNAAKTGAAVFAATLPIEFIPASLVALGMSRKNMPGRGAIEWMHHKLGAGGEDDQKRTKLNVVKDGALALGVGAAAVVAKRFISEKKMTFKEGVKTSAVLAPTVALFSGGVGYATAFGILHAEGSRFEGAASFLENNGTDAKFWLAVFGALQVADFAGKAIKKRKADPTEF